MIYSEIHPPLLPGLRTNLGRVKAVEKEVVGSKSWGLGSWRGVYGFHSSLSSAYVRMQLMQYPRIRFSEFEALATSYISPMALLPNARVLLAMP